MTAIVKQQNENICEKKKQKEFLKKKNFLSRKIKRHA